MVNIYNQHHRNRRDRPIVYYNDRFRITFWFGLCMFVCTYISCNQCTCRKYPPILMTIDTEILTGLNLDISVSSDEETSFIPLKSASTLI